MSTQSPVDMGFAECVGVNRCVYSDELVPPSWWLELAIHLRSGHRLRLRGGGVPLT
jgi:hypothetical protein